jgi:predicted RNA-binding Zn-ribbon protein involved in translation (DUF1610 family)
MGAKTSAPIIPHRVTVGALGGIQMSWLEQAVQFVTSLFIYFVIFSAIGMLFYFLDRRVRRHISRIVRCQFCGEEIEIGLLQRAFGRCPACGRRQTTAVDHEDQQVDPGA